MNLETTVHEAIQMRFREIFGEAFKVSEPLARYTSARVGGPAEMFLTVENATELQLAAELANRLVEEELPPEVLERKEVRDQLLLAITELPSGDQDLIAGHYFDGAAFAELARRTGLSERAIEGRLYRARQALREKLRHLA